MTLRGKAIKNIAVLWGLLFLSNCGTVRVPVSVTHPAEINMRPYKQVVISDIYGNMGQGFSDILKNRLVESQRFQVVDRARLYQIVSEINLSNTDLTDPNTRVKLGRLLGASALITGHTESKYHERRWKEDATLTVSPDTAQKEGYKKCKSVEKGRRVECPIINFYREGKTETTGSIDVIDIQTSRIIKSKLLNNTCMKTTQVYSQSYVNPPLIESAELQNACLMQNVNSFLKAISPWTEIVHVPFEKDKAIPELERGIRTAQIGNMKAAVEIFISAIRDAEGDSTIKPKTLSKGYWNLALAYEYSNEFDKALEALDKAYSLNPLSIYITEKSNIFYRRAEKKKLEEQEASR